MKEPSCINSDREPLTGTVQWYWPGVAILRSARKSEGGLAKQAMPHSPGLPQLKSAVKVPLPKLLW